MTRKKSAARSRLHIEHFTAGPYDPEKSAVLNRLHIEHFTAGPHDPEKVRRPELKSPTKLTESFFIRNTPETNAEKECFPKLLSVLFGRTCHVVFLCVSFPETAYSLLLRERRAHSFRPKDLTFSLIYRAYTTSIPFVFSFPVSSALFQPGLLSRSGKNTEACPTASAKVTKASLQ